MNKNIEHHTERVPGLFRNEIYKRDDICYTEQFDDLTGERLFGNITMFDNIHVCNVHADGTITMNFPTSWVVGHKEMLILMDDIKRLDTFISDVCPAYK